MPRIGDEGMPVVVATGVVEDGAVIAGLAGPTLGVPGDKLVAGGAAWAGRFTTAVPVFGGVDPPVPAGRETTTGVPVAPAGEEAGAELTEGAAGAAGRAAGIITGGAGREAATLAGVTSLGAWAGIVEVVGRGGCEVTGEEMTGAFAGGRFEAGATVTVGRTGCGGRLAASASACLRSRIAFSASPGLET